MSESSAASKEDLRRRIAQHASTKKCEKWDGAFTIEDLTVAREKIILRHALPCDSQFGVPAKKTAESYKALRNLVFPVEAAKQHETFVFCLICYGKIENNEGNTNKADRHYKTHSLPSANDISQGYRSSNQQSRNIDSHR